MPKKTYEINGFAKGINKVSSPLDLDKEECIEAQGVLLDSPGKITRRLGAATTVSSHSFADGNNQEKTAGYVVVGAGATPRIYAKQGAYSVHGDINYSSNIEHDPPVQAALGDTGNDANQTNLVITDVTSKPTYVVFGGKDAIDKDGAAHAKISENEAGTVYNHARVRSTASLPELNTIPSLPQVETVSTTSFLWANKKKTFLKSNEGVFDIYLEYNKDKDKFMKYLEKFIKEKEEEAKKEVENKEKTS